MNVGPAFYEGFDAWHSGNGLEDNPYAVDTREANEWAEGYTLAGDEFIESDHTCDWCV